MPPLDRVPGPEGAGPRSDPRTDALLRARSRLPPGAPLPVEETPQAEAFDAISAAAGLDQRLKEPHSPGGLAGMVLDFVAPARGAPTSPTRLLGLLEVAAGVLAHAPPGDDIARLGALAIRQELDAHRDLAERRGTLVGP
ncbi:hypothetical protein ACE7GA_22280 [Roseomonas sp. CCTCC AB2023176]|uniref:hypothetical protein n=1 Tax=Roseomonas sp. CCTCC AB2023176 TaxID=3342640 RepID=UPI0035E25255